MDDNLVPPSSLTILSFAYGLTPARLSHPHRQTSGNMAAFTILPQPFRTSSYPGATSIPRATADPGTLSRYTTTTTSATTSESVTSRVSSWSDRGGISVYTDVRTTGTPRLAAEYGTISNR
jgi:hypothetical protein